MECDDYQRAALRTARDKDAPDEFMHLVLGLVGEAGEIAEKVKKLVRDHDSDLAMLDRDDMAAELGDVLWYAAVLASFVPAWVHIIFGVSFAALGSVSPRLGSWYSARRLKAMGS